MPHPSRCTQSTRQRRLVLGGTSAGAAAPAATLLLRPALRSNGWFLIASMLKIMHLWLKLLEKAAWQRCRRRCHPGCHRAAATCAAGS